MSLNRLILFGAWAGWTSRAVSIFLGLILMPVLFRQMGKEELGVWLLLGQTWSILGVLDLGLGVTLTRRIALAKGASGSNLHADLSQETRQQIADLVTSGRRLYCAVALVAFVASTLGGYFCLRQLHLTSLSLSHAWLAWAILCLSQAFGLWAGVWTCLLQGIGYVGWDSIVLSLVNTLVLVCQIAALLLGGNLLALALIAALGAVTQRSCILRLARTRRPELFRVRGHWNGNLVRSLVAPALRAWLTSLGGVVVLNSDQFFIAQFRGAAEIPVYRAGYLILLNVNMLAVAMASASSVFVSHLWQAGDLARIRRLVRSNLVSGLSVMVVGGASILALGPRLFDFWLRPGHFPGYPLLTVFFLLLTLEAQAFIISTLSRATEDEAFAGTSLIAAVLKVVFSWVLVLKFGLLGIALGTLLAQLLTNHWFMLVRGLSRLGISLAEHLRQVVAPVAVISATAGAAVWAVRLLVSDFTAGIAVAAGAATAGLVLAAGLWQFCLDGEQRARVRALILRKRFPQVSRD